MAKSNEVFISVDVEASGPIPGEYSLLTIGACDAYEPTRQFSCTLKPITAAFIPEAMAVTGLSLDALAETGLEPSEAMKHFETWLLTLPAASENLVFVGFNAAFDWSFVNHYFHRFLGRNPFGFSALDIKSLYMGATGCDWSETRSSRMVEALKPTRIGDHDALHDAIFQAELFRLARQRP